MDNSKHTVRYSSPDGKVNSSRKLALITGATSGIGKAFAEYFAAHDFDLLITGRRRDAILNVATELETSYGINVDIIIADLSKNDDISLLLQVIGKRKNIEVLVNNAGYGMDSKFSEDELDHQLAMLRVHVNAPLMLIHKVLPIMMENKRGIIINVSSLAAFMPTAGNGMYTSTKSFLKNFTESLHMDVSNYGIHVQCLCPGFTYSDFHRNLNISRDGLKQGLIRWMKPSSVVNYSIACLNKGQVLCIPGFMNRIVGLLAIFIPRSLYYLISIRMENKIKKHQYDPGLVIMQAVQSKRIQPSMDSMFKSSSLQFD